VATALEAAAPQDFPVLRQVVARRTREGPDEGQLEFSIDLVIAGLERTVGSRSQRPEGRV
jgi:hypothetical protein